MSGTPETAPAPTDSLLLSPLQLNLLPHRQEMDHEPLGTIPGCTSTACTSEVSDQTSVFYCRAWTIMPIPRDHSRNAGNWPGKEGFPCPLSTSAVTMNLSMRTTAPQQTSMSFQPRQQAWGRGSLWPAGESLSSPLLPQSTGQVSTLLVESSDRASLLYSQGLRCSFCVHSPERDRETRPGPTDGADSEI